MNIVLLNYKGEFICFNIDGWINVIDIVKCFGKCLDYWLFNIEIFEYVRVLDEVYLGELLKILYICDFGYVKISKV